jgi:membrane-bound lytic murein transglycosylase
MDDRNKKIVKKGVLHKDTIKVIKQLAKKMKTSTEDFEVFKEPVNEGSVEWFWNAARENPEKKKNYTKFSNNIDQQKGKLTKDIVLKKAKEYKVKSEDALKFVSDMYADIKFESVNKGTITFKNHAEIDIYPDTDSDGYHPTPFKKGHTEKVKAIKDKGRRFEVHFIDGSFAMIDKDVIHVNEPITEFIQKEVKALIKKKAKLVKEGAIRQWVIEGSPDMVLKVPQSTEMSQLNKRDFQAFLKHHKIDFDHIADDEMDEFSHYLIYSDISPEMLKDLQDTYHASF